jgi:glycopeptide antibiotics resistance protein
MVGIAVINWLIPMTYCFIRSMISFNSKAEEFNSFYRNSSILFLISYAVILIYGFFFKDAFPWAYDAGTDVTGFTPFEILAIQIEDYISGSLPLYKIFNYLACRILIFIPYGFYIRLVLRNKKRLLRIVSLFILPVILEILQYLIIPERFSLDDMVYALIGGFLGFFAYFLTNTIYHAFSGNNFLNGADYRRPGRNPLHF